MSAARGAASTQAPSASNASASATGRPSSRDPHADDSPVERLNRSRARLRKALLGRPGQGRAGTHGDAATADPDAPQSESSSPLATFMRLATQWWSEHPLRTAAGMMSGMAGPAAKDILAPIARRYPWRLVLGAAGLGAAIVWARPWRWLPQAALSSALLSALWPRGSLSRWLASGGLVGLLTSDELRHWLRNLTGTRDEPSAPGPDTAPPGAAGARATSEASQRADEEDAVDPHSAAWRDTQPQDESASTETPVRAPIPGSAQHAERGAPHLGGATGPL